MWTPGQVSDMLKIPPSTLRRYAADFADHLSPGAQRSRGRRFNESDVDILARARELLGQGRSPAEVSAILPVIAESEGEGPDAAKLDSALALVPSIGGALRRALDETRLIRADFVEVAATVGDLRTEVHRLRARSDAQAEAFRRWAAGPWYRRLLTSPELPDAEDSPPLRDRI